MKPSFESENGRAWYMKKEDILYIPIIIAKERGKGYGTKLVIELENIVKKDPKLKEIAFASVLSRFLIKILVKRSYSYRKEFSEEFGEFVDIFYSTFINQESRSRIDPLFLEKKKTFKTW